jgi:hypothetical protein
MSSTLARLITVTCTLLAVSAGRLVFAQTPKYSKGDRVEVNDVFDGWKKGTVVSTNPRMGRVEVQIDESEDEDAQDFPESMRARMLTRSYRVNQLRPLAEAKAARPRKWTDRTGKFSVTARFGGVEGDSVILIRTGGKQVKVPLEKLSDEDQQYVKSQNESEQNPFGEPDPEEPEAQAANTKKANWQGVRELRPETFKKWSFTPAGKTQEPSTTPSVRDLEVPLAEIPDSKKFFEGVEGIYVSRDGNRIILCRKQGAVARYNPLYLEEIDAATQRGKGLVALPEVTAVLDIEPDQGLVMFRPDQLGGDAENGLLTIARLEGDKLVPSIAWEPYADQDFEPARAIEEANFLSADRVMTINAHGRALTIWDAEAAKALINIPVGFNVRKSLSPDKTLLAVVMENGIAIIDLAAGRHVATIDAIGRDIRQVAFRADNARLAAVSSYGAQVWDLTNGKQLSSFASMRAGARESLAWAGDFLLVQNQYLYEVERRILLWEYEGDLSSASAATMQNGRLYVVPRTFDDGAETKLVSAALPHRSPLDLAKRLPSPEELLVVRPGDEVQLDVDVDPSIAMTEEVRKQLTSRLKDLNLGVRDAENAVNPGAAPGDLVREVLAAALRDAGFKVVDKSNLVVKAICKPQEQQTIRVNVGDRFRPRPEDIEERSITPHASYLEMTHSGEQLWKRGFVTRPHMMIYLNQGESLDEALARYTQPNFTIFSFAMFSPYVAKPGKATPNGAYGVSQFTARGIVDGSSSGEGRAAFE